MTGGYLRVERKPEASASSTRSDRSSRDATALIESAPLSPSVLPRAEGFVLFLKDSPCRKSKLTWNITPSKHLLHARVHPVLATFCAD